MLVESILVPYPFVWHDSKNWFFKFPTFKLKLCIFKCIFKKKNRSFWIHHQSSSLAAYLSWMTSVQSVYIKFVIMLRHQQWCIWSLCLNILYQQNKCIREQKRDDILAELPLGRLNLTQPKDGWAWIGFFMSWVRLRLRVIKLINMDFPYFI